MPRESDRAENLRFFISRTLIAEIGLAAVVAIATYLVGDSLPQPTNRRLLTAASFPSPVPVPTLNSSRGSDLLTPLHIATLTPTPTATPIN